LGQIDQLRRQLQNALPSPGNFKAADRVLLQMKGALQDHMDQLFQNDMISGDEASLNAWKNARGLTKDIADRFEANKTIYRLLTSDATPEEVHNFLFNASESGVKAGAGAVVQKLKQIFGENSPQINAVRLEMLTDALAPLRDVKNPDWQAFVNYYDKTVRNNPTLMKELSPYAKSGLDDIYNLAKANIKTGHSAYLQVHLPTIISRFLVGSQLAHRAALVRLGAWVIDASMGNTTRSVRNRLITQLTGVDPVKSIVPAGSPITAAVQQEALSKAFHPEDHPDADTQ
jgi:hypothetical protein